jgi:hypothetical protein
MGEADESALFRHWTQSRVGGQAGETVFLPAQDAAVAALQRSRGVPFSFEIHRDGTAVYFSPGPVDRPQTTKGVWKREGNRLELYVGPSSQPARVMEIVSLAQNRLVVRG